MRKFNTHRNSEIYKRRKKPKKGEECRKRRRNPSKWTRAVRKETKIAGKEYVITSGKNIAAKQMREPYK